MENQQKVVQVLPGEEDRINKLPEDLHLQILRKLPRRHAIRTGVLAKSWKDLWKRCQSCNHSTMLKVASRYNGGSAQEELANRIQQYMLQHKDKKIEAFHLYFYPEDWNVEKVAEWIQQAIASGVDELYLDFSQGILGSKPSGQLAPWIKKYRLDESIFRFNKSVIGLNISFCIMNQSFKFNYFDCLESLCLQGVNFNDRMLAKLLVNCPQLQSLELRECMSLRCIMIIGTHLRVRKLTVVHCRRTKEISISTPMLTTFHFFGKFPSIFSFGINASLSNVIIISSVRDDWVSPSNWDVMLTGLEHAQVLTICDVTLQAIFGSANTTEINLNNLQELQLRIEKMSNANLLNIYKFFMCCQLQLLERLFIELPTCWTDPDLEISLEMVTKDPPNLHLDNLQIIKLNNFKGHANEITVAEYFLKNASRLRLLIVSFLNQEAGTVQDATKLFQQLKQKTRASPDVDMVMTVTSLDGPYNLQPKHEKIIPGFNPPR